MLPDDFEWRSYIDGPALYLGDRMLAVSTRLERSWRVDFVLYRRSEFFASEEGATRYVTAWEFRALMTWDALSKRRPGRRFHATPR